MESMKKVIVLGAGTVGEAVAKQLLNRDCSVFLCDDDSAKLDAAGKRLDGVSTLLIKDLKADAAKTIAVAVETMGGLDGFVCALDNDDYQPFETQEFTYWRKLRERFLDVPFIWGQAVGNKLSETQEDSFIIYILRDLCTRQDPDDPAFCAVESGLKGLLRTMALTLGKHRVTVNGIAVGTLDTSEDLERLGKMAAFKGITAEAMAEVKKAETLTGRLQTAEDVAQLCEFVIWEAINISGQVLLLNGGTCFN